MLMSPNKDETAVHGCHCQGDMAVRMRKVLQTAGLVFECVTCFFRVSFNMLDRRQRSWDTLQDTPRIVDNFFA